MASYRVVEAHADAARELSGRYGTMAPLGISRAAAEPRMHAKRSSQCRDGFGEMGTLEAGSGECPSP